MPEASRGDGSRARQFISRQPKASRLRSPRLPRVNCGPSGFLISVRVRRDHKTGWKPMSVTAERKKEIMAEYATGEGDTGSPEVQVAVLSERIANLTEHFKTHNKDNHSRRGLIKLVSQRRRLLDYVKSKDQSRYESLIQRLGLRR